MIDRKFLVCTECLKSRKRKAKRYDNLRHLNIHLRRAHRATYLIRLQKGSVGFVRVKRADFRGNVGI